MKWLMKWFWPVHTGKTFFDVWSLAHLSFWLFIGSVLWSAKTPRVPTLIACMAVAYGWEVFERYAERRWPHIWLTPETPLNSWVSDPLMCLIGVLGMWWALDYWRVP